MIDKSNDVGTFRFDIVWRGYDREQVKAYLSEVGADLQQLEARAKAAEDRLRASREKTFRLHHAGRGPMADFVAVNRLPSADRVDATADRIEHVERVRVDYRGAATAIVKEAKEEARRIIETALLANEPVENEQDLEEARAEAKRIFDEANAVADRLIASSRSNMQDVEVEPTGSLTVDLTASDPEIAEPADSAQGEPGGGDSFLVS